MEFWGIEFEFATRIRHIGLYESELVTYDSYGDQDLYVNDDRGYASIALEIAKEAGIDIDNIENSESIIRLNNAVKSVEYRYDNSKGVRITVEDLTTNNEYTLTAEYGIITFSLGVLQSGIVNFEPSLPNWKLGSIMTFQNAYYLPIYIQWPYNFWDEYNISSNILLFNDDRYGYWISCFNYDTFKEDSLLWRFDITSELALRMAFESKDNIINEIMNKLRPYFNISIPNPIDIFKPDWISNKYFQGSYSGWPNGFDETDKDMLGYRLNNLFFAGEAFQNDDNGYLHTSYISGKEKAEQIGKCMGKYKDGTCPKVNKYKDGNWGGIPAFIWWIIGSLSFMLLCCIIYVVYTKCKERKLRIQADNIAESPMYYGATLKETDDIESKNE